MTQSILFTAAAVALTSSYRALNLITENRIKFLVEILCGVGFLFGCVMWRSIWATRYEQRLVRGLRKSDLDEVFPCCDDFKACLQASHSRTLLPGFTDYSVWLPIVSTLLWLLLFFFVVKGWV